MRGPDLPTATPSPDFARRLIGKTEADYHVNTWSNAFTPLWNARGELTDDGEKYTYIYDVWGRLRKIKNRSGGALVAEYWYNGLGYLIGIHEDSSGNGTTDTNDPVWRLVYDERWRVVAVHSGTETGPREIYVHHNAGFGGFGGSSYIDQLILRDRDPDGGNPLVLSERVYHCQNMRHDVVALIDANGEQVEQARYSAYGVPFCLPAADCDSDGDVDVFDFIQLGDWINASVYDVRADVNLDGVLNVFDYTELGDRSGNAGGRGKLSIANGSKPTNSRFGYAGYLWHQNVGKCHVRNRVYDPALGRWITRDPIEYAAGASSLYEYCNGMPVIAVDYYGLQAWIPVHPDTGEPLPVPRMDPRPRTLPAPVRDPTHEWSITLRSRQDQGGLPGQKFCCLHSAAGYMRENNYVCDTLYLSSHGSSGQADWGPLGLQPEVLEQIRQIRRDPNDPNLTEDSRRRLRAMDEALRELAARAESIVLEACCVAYGQKGEQLLSDLQGMYPGCQWGGYTCKVFEIPVTGSPPLRWPFGNPKPK